MRMRKIWKVLSVTTAVCGGAATLYATYYNDWQFRSFGVVRFARAGLTIGRITVDYKWSLRNVNADSDSYPLVLSRAHKRSADRLLRLACANGGVWIKLGQHLSALEYLLPSEYTSTLSVLYSRGPESTFEEICGVIKDELKIQDLSECFTSFDHDPIGAASLAQVYRATTNDQRDVAVKVQHPQVKPHSMMDMFTVEILVKFVALVFPEFRLSWLVDEMKKNLPNELAFLTEAENTERVKKMFQHLPFLVVPSICWDLSTDRCLVMEYCDGGQINDLQYITSHNISTSEVCRKLGQLYSEMIFEHGYVHCDPHPGNVLVRKHNGTVQLVLLDHGLYTVLPDQIRLNYASFWLALLNRDLDAMRIHASQLGVGHLYGLFACMVTQRSWRSITAGIDRHAMSTAENEEIQQYVTSWLPQISHVLERVPRPMVLVFKTNDLLRSIEYVLGQKHSPLGFVQMSKYCVHTVYMEKLRTCESWLCRVRVCFWTYMSLTKLWLYETYLLMADCIRRKDTPTQHIDFNSGKIKFLQ